MSHFPEYTLWVSPVQAMNRGGAIPALTRSRTPGLALHSTHSYGYAFRSSAASSRPIPSSSSGILGAICGLAA
jgi:hypothetical protein